MAIRTKVPRRKAARGARADLRKASGLVARASRTGAKQLSQSTRKGLSQLMKINQEARRLRQKDPSLTWLRALTMAGKQTRKR